jgi:O-antigen/teichoic acid export membrane protein
VSRAPAEASTKPGLLRSATVYAASNILERAIPVLILPILTFYLSPADVGMIAVFTAALGIFGLFVGVNVSYAVRRRFFDAGSTDFPVYVGNCVGLLAAGTAAGLVLVGTFGTPLARISGLPVVWLAGAVLVAGAQEFLMVPLTIWQVEHRPGRYAWTQVARSAAVAALTALFVIVFSLGWRGAAAAIVVTAVVFAALVGAPALRPWIRLRFDRSHVLHALRYGGGLIPHTLGTLAMRSVDRFVIGYYVGASENGLYWVGYQIGFAVSLAADAFNRAWSPWLYAGLGENDSATDRRIVRFTYGYFAGIAAFAALLCAVAPLLVRYLLAPEFRGAGRFVWWIALGFMFNGMYAVVSGFVFYSERTLVLSVITALAAAVNLTLNFALVPRLGAIGAAQATAIAFLLRFLLTWGAAERLRPMPWRLAGAPDR